MVSGSCLCGAVAFEARDVVGPFELCHCRRCRKVSGSAYAALVGVRREGYRITRGNDLVMSFELPVEEAPPGYGVFFCSVCGSPLPEPHPTGDWLEIPAGLFDTPLPVEPDKHIFVEFAANWHTIDDTLPRLTKAELIRHRSGGSAG
jgi:hypothetical protein